MDLTDTQLILNIVTALALLISEILGLSKCQSNGIVDFAVRQISCFKVFHFYSHSKESKKADAHPDRIAVLEPKASS